MEYGVCSEFESREEYILVEGKKRIKATEYNPSFRGRNDRFLGGTDATENIHRSRRGRRWLDINVDELLQTLDIRSFGARGPVR